MVHSLFRNRIAKQQDQIPIVQSMENSEVLQACFFKHLNGRTSGAFAAILGIVCASTGFRHVPPILVCLFVIELFVVSSQFLNTD